MPEYDPLLDIQDMLTSLHSEPIVTVQIDDEKVAIQLGVIDGLTPAEFKSGRRLTVPSLDEVCEIVPVLLDMKPCAKVEDVPSTRWTSRVSGGRRAVTIVPPADSRGTDHLLDVLHRQISLKSLTAIGYDHIADTLTSPLVANQLGVQIPTTRWPFVPGDECYVLDLAWGLLSVMDAEHRWAGQVLNRVPTSDIETIAEL